MLGLYPERLPAAITALGGHRAPCSTRYSRGPALVARLRDRAGPLSKRLGGVQPAAR